MAQLLPLVTMCVNTNPRGLFFAGDTAQSISRGSVFRFQDLSSMIYRVLESKDLCLTAKSMPKVFKLSRNYRSHDGILKLAASCLDLLNKYFPGCIDLMERDTGAVDGPKPICFLEQDIEEFLGLFGLTDGNETSAGESIEFGADQVILIRDEKYEEELRKRIGDCALVLTIEQAKGMEFSDVLLYSPFAKSQAGNKWRVFLNEVKGNTEKFPKFYNEKHNILATELKILYTAITRARHRLWIFDENIESRRTIFSYWNSLGLVEQAETSKLKSNSQFRAFAQKSSALDWANKGKELFERRQYQPALFCFKRESMLDPNADPNKIKTCEAWFHLQRAKSLKGEESQKEFELSADAFLLLTEPKYKLAADCFEMAKKFHRAGTIFKQEGMWKDAARCFDGGGYMKDAGHCFEMLGQPRIALEYFKRGQHLFESIRCVEKNHTEFKPNERSVVKRAAFLSAKEFEQKTILEFFDDKEIVSVLRMKRDFIELAKFYRTKGQFSNSAGIFESNLDNLSDAGEDYFKAEEYGSSASCFLNLVLKIPPIYSQTQISSEETKILIPLLKRCFEAVERWGLQDLSLKEQEEREKIEILARVANCMALENIEDLLKIVNQTREKKIYSLHFISMEAYIQVFLNLSHSKFNEYVHCAEILEEWTGMLHSVIHFIYDTEQYHKNTQNISVSTLDEIAGASRIEHQFSLRKLKPFFFTKNLYDSMIREDSVEYTDRELYIEVSKWLTECGIRLTQKFDDKLAKETTYRKQVCLYFLFGKCSKDNHAHPESKTYSSDVLKICESLCISLNKCLETIRTIQHRNKLLILPDEWYINTQKAVRRNAEKLITEFSVDNLDKNERAWMKIKTETRKILKSLVLKVWINKFLIEKFHSCCIESALLFENLCFYYPGYQIEKFAKDNNQPLPLLRSLKNFFWVNNRISIKEYVKEGQNIIKMYSDSEKIFHSASVFNYASVFNSASVIFILQKCCSLTFLCSQIDVILPKSLVLSALNSRPNINVSDSDILSFIREELPKLQNILLQAINDQIYRHISRLHLVQLCSLFLLNSSLPLSDWGDITKGIQLFLRVSSPIEFLDKMASATNDPLIFIKGCQKYPAQRPGLQFREATLKSVKFLADFRHARENSQYFKAKNPFLEELENLQNVVRLNPKAKEFKLDDKNLVAWQKNETISNISQQSLPQSNYYAGIEEEVSFSQTGSTAVSDGTINIYDINDDEPKITEVPTDEQISAATVIVKWLRKYLSTKTNVLRVERFEKNNNLKKKMLPTQLDDGFEEIDDCNEEKKIAGEKIARWILHKHRKRKGDYSRAASPYWEIFLKTKSWIVSASPEITNSPILIRRETVESFIYKFNPDLVIDQIYLAFMGYDGSQILANYLDVDWYELVPLINIAISDRNFALLEFLLDELFSDANFKRVSKQVTYRMLFLGYGIEMCTELERELRLLRPMCESNPDTAISIKNCKKNKRHDVAKFQKVLEAIDQVCSILNENLKNAKLVKEESKSAQNHWTQIFMNSEELHQEFIPNKNHGASIERNEEISVVGVFSESVGSSLNDHHIEEIEPIFKKRLGNHSG
ncbi:hypothetical protein HK096_009265, partial [Nowakowskiella sp. JEL0078]